MRIIFKAYAIAHCSGSVMAFCQVSSPLQQSKLNYRNTYHEEERYSTTSTLRRRQTATRPTPISEVETYPLRSKTSPFRPWMRQTTRAANKPSNGINGEMVKKLILSQVTLLSLMTAVALAATTILGGTFMDSLNWVDSDSLAGDSSFLGRCLLGAYAAIPMIYVSQLVDQASSQRDASHVHFATTNMVVSLFGRRQRHANAKPNHESNNIGMALAHEPAPLKTETTSTIEVILSSLGLSFCTSVAEEVVFRGYLPTLVLALSHNPALAWLSQSFIFGLCHIHPNAQQGENRVVAATQTFNALFGYGLVYGMTGGDLWPCIVAHALYDMHVLVSSWHRVNSQIDWTEDAIQETLSDKDASALQQLRTLAGPSLTSETLNLCRRFFFAFDEDHQRALSLPNVQRAVSYAFLSDSHQPSSIQVQRLFERVLYERGQSGSVEVASDRITLSEFVRLLFSLRAQTLKVAT